MRKKFWVPDVILLQLFVLSFWSGSVSTSSSLSLDALALGEGSSGSNLGHLDLFNNEDLIAFVQELECQAGDDDNKEGTGGGCYLPVGKVRGVLEDDDTEDEVTGSNVTTSTTEGKLRLSLLDDEVDEDGDDDEQDEEDDAVDADLDVLLPRDLSDLGEEISDDVSDGVEESLRMFGGNFTKGLKYKLVFVISTFLRVT